MAYIWQLVQSIAPGLVYTIGLFALTIVISMPLGLLLSFLRVNCKNKLARGVLKVYVDIMRGTPLMLQLFFFYFGVVFLPYIGDYLVFGRFQAAAIAFVLNYAAYFCEIFRGGIISVEAGQYEAAQVLGLTRWQTIRRVVIPQMLRVSLPSIGNESITLVKDTALISALSCTEILYFANSAVNRDGNPLAFLVVAVFYLLMNNGLAALFARLERRYSY